MKRATELIPLSQEHNTALKLARDAKRAAREGTEREVSEVWRQLSRAWYTEMAPHFRAEEQLLFPILREAGEQTMADELEREHRAMQKALEDPRRQDRPRLDAIGHVLNDHVRREEREAFPLIEALLTPEQKSQIGHGLALTLYRETRDAS